jgi:hypothetical protein
MGLFHHIAKGKRHASVFSDLLNRLLVAKAKPLLDEQ